ncbi:MAG: hypothetical protein MUC43_06875 [Pirellula sp.]|jgi:hypothetical protein|nr:hypothetical protein [Pirellula sp.]
MNSKNRNQLRFGLTLVEVLIATTLTLLLMLSLAQGFKVLSESVSEGRTRLTLSDQLRGLSNLVRQDLDRCTVDGKSPQAYQGSGYLKYYDGPVWDATALQANFTSADPLFGSRWGDIDDTLMLTAKARPGDVFRGTVPKALMVINQLNKFEMEGLFPGVAVVDNFIAPIVSGGANFWRNAWTTDVTIESDHAEIAWFMMPLAEGNRLPIPTPYSGPYIPTSVNQTVIDLAPVDGMPDRIALCRRVQLVRSDIDLNPFPVNSVYRNLIQTGIQNPVAPQLLSGQNPLTAKFVMSQFYQRCDLSLSPHVWERAEQSGGSRPVYVKSNSLVDLQLPENRFAHFTFPVSVSGGSNPDATLLPMLALTDEIGVSATGADTAAAFRVATQTTLNWAVAGAAIVNPAPIIQARGFIPPCFMRSRLTLDSTGAFLYQPTLSEIVATNVVAFDVKAFDPAAKLLAHPGNDTIYGEPATTLAGIAGTDDAAVTPSDPGYGTLLASGTTPIVAALGAHTDMGWGYKLLSHPSIVGLSPAARASISDFFRGNGSGILTLTNSASPAYIRDPSLLSGGALARTPLPSFIFQPNFDTYTDYYEIDGERFDLLTTSVGVVPAYRNGLRRFGLVSPPGIPDVTGNGVHNFPVSRESIPPAPYELPSIKVSIRVQDISAGALQQISVVHGMTNL